MKPPFELPVKIFKCSVQESLSQEVYGIEDSILIIAQGMTKEQADYIVAVINSHEKLVDTLNIVLEWIDYPEEKSIESEIEVTDIIRKALELENPK